MKLHQLFVPWGGRIARIDMERGPCPEHLFSPNPRTGLLERLEPQRLRIYWRGQEVAWRCRVADARTGEIAVMIPQDGRKERGEPPVPWVLLDDGSDTKTLRLTAQPVRIEYDWPEGGHGA